MFFITKMDPATKELLQPGRMLGPWLLDCLPLNYLAKHPMDCLVVGRHGELADQDKIMDMVMIW
jgi:hypothetical protein